MKGERIFCGGTFCFDYRKEGYEVMAAKDYRAVLIGSVDALLNPKGNAGFKISEGLVYIGPFYFETESMKAEDIVRCEKEMIESCTDAICMLILWERNFICFMFNIRIMKRPRANCIHLAGIRYNFAK